MKCDFNGCLPTANPMVVDRTIFVGTPIEQERFFGLFAFEPLVPTFELRD